MKYTSKVSLNLVLLVSFSEAIFSLSKSCSRNIVGLFLFVVFCKIFLCETQIFINMLIRCRRYFGHKPTIRPNAKKLYKLFLNRDNITWEEFSSRVRTHQIGFMGAPNEVKPGRGEFHENPSSCICEVSAAKANEIPSLQSQNHSSYNKIDQDDNTSKDTSDATDEQIFDDEQDWSELDYMDNGNRFQGKEGLPNGTDSDPSFVLKSDPRELDEFFSD